VVRDYVNILDKGNWNLFGIYALAVWASALIIMPGIVYFLSFAGVRMSKSTESPKEMFFTASGAIIPLSLMLWIAFVVPMLFVNISFVLQSLSDPFGWGWDFLGTANTPWHQFMPRIVPIIQAVLILSGLYLSVRNLNRSTVGETGTAGKSFSLLFPVIAFMTTVAVIMIFFFTN
jgi:hypothetical protein